MDDLTVCITSFKRPELLKRALDSVAASGLKRALVFNMCGDLAVLLATETHPEVGFYSLSVDLGCNELWLQAAYRAETERVLILHDDDLLQHGLADTYEKTIAPALKNGVGFASWRAHVQDSNGKVRPCEYFNGVAGVHPSSTLKQIVLQRGRLSLSPIISVFDRKTLIGAVKESGEVLPKLRKGMHLGTEILVYLRHCAAYEKWLYVDKVLSLYGSHEGSGTVQAERSGNIKPLTRGYDVAREHFERYPQAPIIQRPRILLVSAPFDTQDKDEVRRFTAARRTWETHFNTGNILDFPLCNPKRSSADIGDGRAVPYLRDLLDYGVARAMPEDIVAYSNLDLSLAGNAVPQILTTVQASGGVCCAWRRTQKHKGNYALNTVRSAPKDGGIDLVAVTPSWWKEHRNKIPDMFVAGNFWDYCFRVFAEQLTKGTCYMDDGTYHEPHAGMMDRVGMKNPVQQHNLKLAKQFFKERQMDSVVKFLTQYDAK